jgi:hypothetical protein
LASVFVDDVDELALLVDVDVDVDVVVVVDDVLEELGPENVIVRFGSDVADDVADDSEEVVLAAAVDWGDGWADCVGVLCTALVVVVCKLE